MKIFFSAYKADYKRYRFPYQVLLKREPKDSLEEIYNRGFLPFRHRQDLFYLARSCRSNLDNYRLSSENRRVLKRTEGFSFRFKKITPINFRTRKKMRDWARAAGWDIKASTLQSLWQGTYFNWLLEVKKEDRVVSASLLLSLEKIIHWAYFFVDNSYRQANLAAASGLRTIQYAQKRKNKYVYLGTCYGQLNYKRNFPGLEFFNGGGWSANKRELSWLQQEEWPGHLWQNKSYRDFIKWQNWPQAPKK